MGKQEVDIAEPSTKLPGRFAEYNHDNSASVHFRE